MGQWPGATTRRVGRALTLLSIALTYNLMVAALFQVGAATLQLNRAATAITKGNIPKPQ